MNRDLQKVCSALQQWIGEHMRARKTPEAARMTGNSARYSYRPEIVPLSTGSSENLLIHWALGRTLRAILSQWWEVISLRLKMVLVLPNKSFFLFSFSSSCFLRPHLQHMEGPRLGVESELRLPVSPTATGTQDLSLFCKLHHHSGQRWILNPLIKARDRTHILTDINLVHNLLSHNGNSNPKKP